MINKNKNISEKGSVLYLFVLIMVILLSVSLMISTMILNEFKMMQEAGDSVVAFYAADSGVERFLYNQRQVSPPILENLCATDDGIGSCAENLNPVGCELDNSAKYYVCYFDNFNNTSEERVHAIGKYKETVRKIELDF